MEANEAQELQEHAEHGSHESTMRPVAFTMSVLAVLVAVTTVLGHRTHTEAVLDQNKATDQWNEYQAHKIRSNDTALAADLLSVVTVADKDAAAKIAKAYADHQAKWADDLKEEQGKGRGAGNQGGAGRSPRRPLRPGRGAAGDRPGDHFGHAAHAQPHLLVFGHRLLACGDRFGGLGAVSEVEPRRGIRASSVATGTW